MKRSEQLLFILLTEMVSCKMYFSSLPNLLQNNQRDYIWNEALNIMSFHRNKMNEYLCKNYIASEIVDAFKNQSGPGVEEKTTFKNSRLARESLLADTGSQKYRDWLSRSSTLEDIYHQFENSENDHAGHQEVGNGHEGEVTGYALVDHKHVYSKPVEYEEDFHSHGYHKEKEEEDEHHEKGLKLKELFHFALTAIAFLAFACFIIEIIMCLMEVPQATEPDYVLVPTTTGGTGHSKLDTEIPGTQRQGKTLNLDPISLEILNIMSSKVLSSIEALTIIHEDDGQCLQRALCQNSKYSKSLKGTQKIWLPLWSFGLSWIGEKFSRKKNSTRGSNTLKYLTAAVMGLGNGECHILYPKCDERKIRKRRKV